MALPMMIGIFWVVWWITLFVVLPIGVKTQQEAEDIVPGSPESAPHKSMMWKKVGLTTLLSCIVFAFIYWLMVLSPITLDNIPLLPTF